MTRSLVLLCSCLLTTPAWAGAPPSLQAAIERALAQAPRAKASLEIEELDSGKTLFARGATRALIPASNMKLLTTLAGLELLGAERSAIRTRLLLAPAGALWIVGEGDPTISGRFQKGPLLERLALALKARGVREIKGDLVYDARAFDAQRLHPQWEASDAEHWYGAEVAGLSLNDNCLDVTVKPGKTGVEVLLRPQTAYAPVELKASLTGSKRAHRFGIVRVGAHKERLQVRGKVWRQASAQTRSIPVVDPARFFATVLRERLAAHGIQVRGALRPAKPGEQAPSGKPLWERRTRLSRILPVINKRSQNFYAECLFKVLGRRQPDGSLQGQGSWASGAKAVAAYASHTLKLPAAQVEVSDGSGLSRGNRLSARALLAVLRRGAKRKLFRESLARPGEAGTLRRRLRKLPAGAQVSAKTGTLSGVTALSGYLEQGGKTYAFALILNGRGASRRVLDRIVLALAKAQKG